MRKHIAERIGSLPRVLLLIMDTIPDIQFVYGYMESSSIMYYDLHTSNNCLNKLYEQSNYMKFVNMLVYVAMKLILD